MLRWTVHLKGGPGRDYDLPGRDYDTAVAVGHRLYAFGGSCYGPSSAADQIDVHVFNTVSLRWRKLPPQTTEGAGGRRTPPDVPSRRDRHTACLVGGDDDNNVIYVWGGVTSAWEFCDVLFAFNVDVHRWSAPQVSGSAPRGRCDHSACAVGAVMYVFGGFVHHTSSHTNDIHVLDTAAMAWSLLSTTGTPAPATECHSATVIGARMFVFGGQGDQFDYNNRVSVFDTETSCWLSSTRGDQFHEEIGDEEHDRDIAGFGTESSYGWLDRGLNEEYGCLLAQELEYHCCLGSMGDEEEDVEGLYKDDDFCEELYEELCKPDCLDDDDYDDLWLSNGGDDYYEEDDDYSCCLSREERCCRNHHLHHHHHGNENENRTSSDPLLLPTVPEEREGHSAFAFNGELYVFGGHNYNLGRTFNDLWRFSPETWSWCQVRPKGKTPRAWMSRMCCCVVVGGVGQRERAVLFGGCRFMSVPSAVDDVEEDMEEDDDDDTDMYDNLYVLELQPSLATLCQQAVLRYGLDRSGLPHHVRWELETMTNHQQQQRMLI